MELLDLQIFERVARAESISRAAVGLHMAQPSVSQRIQALEAELGRPLFRRHRRGVTLTSEGSIFLEYAERALRLIAEGVAATRDAPEAALHIALAAPPSVSAYFLPPLYRRLAEEGHNVSVRDAHSHEVIQRLLDGSADAGFVLGVPNQPGIRQELLHEDPVVCVAAPAHPLAGRGGLIMADLAGHKLALYAFSREAATLHEALGFPVQGLVKITPAEAARAMAAGGDFITFVPRMTVERDLVEGRLVMLPVHDLPSFSWSISLAYRDRKELSPAAAAVRRSMHSAIGGPPSR